MNLALDNIRVRPLLPVECVRIYAWIGHIQAFIKSASVCGNSANRRFQQDSFIDSFFLLA